MICGLERRKSSFFEKKKQKTFARWRTWPISKWTMYANWQKFFASFFQKIRLPLRLRAPPI
jgi:hypothetical protein